MSSPTNRERYLALAHAIQTGVMYELEHDPSCGTPKHLRVGVNTGKIEHGAMVRLLMEAEVLAYEMTLSERFGTTVKLA